MHTIVQLVTLLNSKFDRKKTVLSQTLAAGSTTVTFTNAKLTSTAKVDIYTDVYGVSPTEVDDGTDGTLILTFRPQQVVVGVSLVIRED